MSAVEALIARAREYETKAIAADDQASVVDARSGLDARLAAISWTTVAIVLREVAEAIEGQEAA